MIEYRSEIARVKLGIAMGNVRDYFGEAEQQIDRLERETAQLESWVNMLCKRMELIGSHAAQANLRMRQGERAEAEGRHNRIKALVVESLSDVGWGREG